MSKARIIGLAYEQVKGQQGREVTGEPNGHSFVLMLKDQSKCHELLGVTGKAGQLHTYWQGKGQQGTSPQRQ